MTICLMWQHLRVWWILSILVVVLDWITKQMIVANLFYGQEIHILPIFDLTLRYNSGAAFSFLSDAGGWQRWMFSIVAITVIAGINLRLVRIGRTRYWEATSLSLIVGGAIGNLHNRVIYGNVIDFLQIHWQKIWYFPVFNIADSAITIGVILMLLEGFFTKSKKG